MSVVINGVPATWEDVSNLIRDMLNSLKVTEMRIDGDKLVIETQ